MDGKKKTRAALIQKKKTKKDKTCIVCLSVCLSYRVCVSVHATFFLKTKNDDFRLLGKPNERTLLNKTALLCTLRFLKLFFRE
jgi:hypothetical protein